MSLFATIEVPCPACAFKVAFEVVNSVNAVGRPDLRDAIIAGTFQKQTCPNCSKEFRMDPRFSYLDAGRAQWIAAFPESEMDAWRVREEEVARLFDKAFGTKAAPAARELGKSMRPRLVFGWAALWEKLAIHDAGLDDVAIEILKIGLLRNMPESPFSLASELRFVRAPADGTRDLAFAWVHSTTTQFLEGVRVGRELYDDIAGNPDNGRALRADFAAATFVDLKRLITVGS